ncbi:hypothetical protein SAMN05421505_103222 [Sinosporangium album]|uniref:Uncharacterized protein n=1 Tax=Sinosporangium album TaxID=504805 RepID=A0A1G7TDV6_9ACTN|nr:hypothetical protein [Sinosporangium album]SDG33224.1 hypothetical protein SAMN05421505_103222 [Sinosporangium album]
MIVHVKPVGDVVEHEPSAHCICGPGSDIVQIPAICKPVGMIYQHHALHPCSEWEAAPER